MADKLKALKICIVFVLFTILSCDGPKFVDDSVFDDWVAHLKEEHAKCGQINNLNTSYKKLLINQELQSIVNEVGEFSNLIVQEINSNVYERGDIPEFSSTSFYLSFDNKRTFKIKMQSDSGTSVEETETSEDPIWITSYKDLLNIYGDDINIGGKQRFNEINYTEFFVVNGKLAVQEVVFICL